MTRLMVLTFWTKERWHDPIPGEHREESVEPGGHHDADHDAHHHGLAHGQTPHETGWSMTLPLIVLAFFAAVGGYVGVPSALGQAIGWENSNRIEAFLEPAIAKVPSAEHAVAASHATPEAAAS